MGVFSSRINYEYDQTQIENQLRSIILNANANNVDLELGGVSGQDSISLSALPSILPQIYNTDIVKSLINIHRDTIKFEKISDKINETYLEVIEPLESNITTQQEQPIKINIEEYDDEILEEDSEQSYQDLKELTIQENEEISEANEIKENNENSNITTTTTTTTTNTMANKYLEGIYNLSFRFDSHEDCIIDIYLGCTENTDVITKRVTSHIHLGPFRFSSGLNQQFQLPSEDYIDLSNYSENEILTFNLEKLVFPVVISLKTISFDNDLNNTTTSSNTQPSSFVTLDKNPSSSPTESQNLIKSQLTFLTLLKCNDKTLAIKPLKQKTFLSQKVYMVHDIYGIESPSDESKECVACLNEYKEVLAIPCRHFCLCNKCAEIIRTDSMKCPICRSPIRALLKIDMKYQNPFPRNETSNSLNTVENNV